MTPTSRYLTIAGVILMGIVLQGILILADCQDTPRRAAVEFTKAFYHLDPAMSARLCKKHLGGQDSDVVEQYILKVSSEARDRGLGLNYMKNILYGVETHTHMIDENTALILDLASESCQVLGRGGVTVLRDGKQERFERRQRFPIRVLGPFRRPSPTTGLPPGVWEWAATVHAQARRDLPLDPPPEVRTLVERREAARSSRDWATADALRECIADLGWQVLDSADGPLLEPAADAFGQDDGGDCPPATEGFSGSRE